jgi:hypothetical protein
VFPATRIRRSVFFFFSLFFFFQLTTPPHLELLRELFAEGEPLAPPRPARSKCSGLVRAEPLWPASKDAFSTGRMVGPPLLLLLLLLPLLLPPAAPCALGGAAGRCFGVAGFAAASAHAWASAASAAAQRLLSLVAFSLVRPANRSGAL